MTTTKLEFINRDCGLIAEAELLGGTWYIEVRTDASLNTIARDSEGDVLEWMLQHGFRRRRPPRSAAERTADNIASIGTIPARPVKPWPNMCR